MAKPASLPTHATDVGRTLEPEAGEKASGFVEGTRTPAKKVNWVIHWLTQWAALLDGLIDSAEEYRYPGVPHEHVRTYHIGAFHPDVAADWQVSFAAAAGLLARPLADAAIGVFHCDDLPEGALVEFVDILCSMSTARTGANRWGVRVFQKRALVPPELPSVSYSEVGTVTYGSTVSLGRILVGPMAVVAGPNGDTELLIVVSAPSGSLDVADSVYCARVFYSTPRPRR